MDRNPLIERIGKWQMEFNELLLKVKKEGDREAERIFLKYQPIFQMLSESLKGTSHVVSQEEFWPDHSSSSNMHQLLERITQKISKLSLPPVSGSSRKKHERLACRGN